MKIFDNWNVAYNGVKIEAVRKILDSGDLISVGRCLYNRFHHFCQLSARYFLFPLRLVPNDWSIPS